MKKAVFFSALVLILFASCRKSLDALVERTKEEPVMESGFTRFTIPKGAHFADHNPYRATEISELHFQARFDSSAIYTSLLEENQYDINKLYGFADNNAHHHEFSARFGWAWNEGALRLYAYVYNQGQVTSQELTTLAIGEVADCRIRVTGSSYVFSVKGFTHTLPRLSTSPVATGYQLYPYFGGDETAPRDIKIWIKDLTGI